MSPPSLPRCNWRLVSTVASAVQERIQGEVLRMLSKITSVKRVPSVSFAAFARNRYEMELQGAIEAGVINQSQVEEMTREDVVGKFMEDQRDELEGQFRTVIALDEIAKREQLTVDEELIAEEAASLLKRAKDGGENGLEVRPLRCAGVRASGADSRPWNGGHLCHLNTSIGGAAQRGGESRAHAAHERVRHGFLARAEHHHGQASCRHACGRQDSRDRCCRDKCGMKPTVHVLRPQTCPCVLGHCCSDHVCWSCQSLPSSCRSCPKSATIVPLCMHTQPL